MDDNQMFRYYQFYEIDSDSLDQFKDYLETEWQNATDEQKQLRLTEIENLNINGPVYREKKKQHEQRIKDIRDVEQHESSIRNNEQFFLSKQNQQFLIYLQQNQPEYQQKFLTVIDNIAQKTGISYTDLYSGKITAMQFIEQVGTAIAGLPRSTLIGGACCVGVSMFIGAKIGIIFGPLGSVIGAFVGALVGAAGYIGVDYFWMNYKQINFEKEQPYQDALIFFQLNDISTQEEVISKKKFLLSSYHPDKHDLSQKQEAEDNFIHAMMSYEIIKSYRTFKGKWV